MASKRCLYESLNVPRTSTADEIRSAYRRLALQLHPDKLAAANGGVSTPAHTAAFQELQNAYEVLSDPVERAYYDSHRSQILFSDSASSSSRKSAFFNVDLFSYFSNSAFSGFTDTGKGFFKVYGDLFVKIYNQELVFAKELDLGAEAVPPAPLIGKMDSYYSQVTAFYNYWLSFTTVLDFVWVDEHRVSSGMDRRTRRQMEEENKKLRKKARKEFNESVRGLAAFAKKRDKRVIEMGLKKKVEEEKKREEEKRKKKEEERKKLERMMAYQEAEWARADEVEEMEEEEEDGKGGKGREEFYCVVCSKKFKSDKQWKNHEQSKKHKDKVADLRTSFKYEDSKTGNGNVEEVLKGFEPPVVEEDTVTDPVDELCEEIKDDLDLKEERVEDVPLRDNDQKSDLADEASILEAMLGGRKNRKNRVEKADQSTAAQDARRKNRKAAKKRTGAEDVKEPEQSPDVGQDSTSSVGEPTSSVEDVEVVRKTKGDQATGNNKNKTQQANGKLVVRKDSDVDMKGSSKGRKQKGNSKVPNAGCETCGETFDTRNKLFSHLGETGHAMLKSK